MKPTKLKKPRLWRRRKGRMLTFRAREGAKPVEVEKGGEPLPFRREPEGVGVRIEGEDED